MRKWYILSPLETCGDKECLPYGKKEEKNQWGSKCISFLDIIAKKAKLKLALSTLYL